MQRSALALLLVAPTLAHADVEYPSSKVKLLAHFDLAALSARSGNTCWGYVSPSGREYALMGCSNKMAIIDVTRPRESKLIASIPHAEGLWSDIKVFKNTAYVSTEASGTGIQVVDLSKIDEGKATLVRTISTPGRSHTISVDEVGGYLYTCGSNEGVSKGATTCFDLKDPLDPKRSGLETLTPVYQHESEVVTYRAGKYKGRTVFFGGGEGRGLEIWDVTDKDKPFLIRRVAYPFVGYCHQGWLSADRKYFYVNDEFDESTNGIATRTLVFDVSDLDKADLVSTYSTGRASIDHNLYIRNDFVFHANYTTGLWIFDTNENPLSPRLCGYFDTFPANDDSQFEGAWSNYPLLPSGIVLISDINSGLFIVDTTEATKTPIAATSATLDGVKGEFSDTQLADADDSSMTMAGSGSGTAVFEGKCKWQNPSQLSFHVRTRSTKSVKPTIELFNWVTGKYDQSEGVDIAPSYQDASTAAKYAANYVEPGTKRVKARLSFSHKGAWSVAVDQAGWTVNP